MSQLHQAAVRCAVCDKVTLHRAVQGEMLCVVCRPPQMTAFERYMQVGAKTLLVVMAVGALLAYLIWASACVTGINTPGVEKCTTTWIIVGYHRECERGPTWDEIARADPELFHELVKAKPIPVVASSAKATPAPIPMPTPPAKTPAPAPPGWWCTRDASGEGTCARAQAECEAYRAANAGFSTCAHQDSAVCHVMSGCFTTDAACVRFERAASRGGLGCESKL